MKNVIIIHAFVGHLSHVLFYDMDIPLYETREARIREEKRQIDLLIEAFNEPSMDYETLSDLYHTSTVSYLPYHNPFTSPTMTVKKYFFHDSKLIS